MAQRTCVILSDDLSTRRALGDIVRSLALDVLEAECLAIGAMYVSPLPHVLMVVASELANGEDLSRIAESLPPRTSVIYPKVLVCEGGARVVWTPNKLHAHVTIRTCDIDADKIAGALRQFRVVK